MGLHIVDFIFIFLFFWICMIAFTLSLTLFLFTPDPVFFKLSSTGIIYNGRWQIYLFTLNCAPYWMKARLLLFWNIAFKKCFISCLNNFSFANNLLFIFELVKSEALIRSFSLCFSWFPRLILAMLSKSFSKFWNILFCQNWIAILGQTRLSKQIQGFF